jgi:hypothetical protein
MTTVHDEALRKLRDASFDVAGASSEHGEAAIFENDTILGFAFFYDTATDLIRLWATDADALIATRRFQLKAAGNKAWNTYVLFLAMQRPSPIEIVALSIIEENLAGYRKIARAGCASAADLNRALLPLLPIQSAPVLEAVDSKVEVRQRATELSPKILDAFLSEADEQIVLQMLEQEA